MQENTCFYVSREGVFSRAPQIRKIYLFVCVFAKSVLKVPREFKETLVCTCSAEVRFLGHRRNAKCTCLYVCFAEVVLKVPRELKKTLVCTCLAEVCFLRHLRIPKYTCLHVFPRSSFERLRWTLCWKNTLVCTSFCYSETVESRK